MATDLTLDQLREQLRKSEAGRAKLRESLALLREKALNTGELLKQHRDLQQKYELTQGELAQECSAREDAAKDVQAAKQAIAAATRSLEEQLRSGKGQGKALQKAAADAAAAAAQAAKASAGVTDLQRQVAELQRRLRQPNATQQSGGMSQGAGPASAAAGSATAATAAPASAALRADIRQLQGQVSRLQERQQSGSGGSQASMSNEVQQLREQVAAQQAELQRMATEMMRWRSAMSMLAGPPAAAGPPVTPDPWVAASPSELMHEASVREGSNMLPSAAAAPPRISSGFLPRRQPPMPGGHGGRGSQHTAAPAAGNTQQNPAAASAGAQPAAASDNLVGDSGGRPKRVIALVAPRAKRAHGGSTLTDDADSQMSEDSEGSQAGLEHEEGTAADLVQCALGRLTHDDEPPSVDAVDEVAAALQEAILEGAAPLTSVIAGFETALLECAAPPHQHDTADVQCMATEAADDGFSLQRLQLLPLWCAPGPRWPITLAAILRCAHAVSVRLQSAYGESSETDERSSFLEDLRAHLHRGASAQGGRAGSRHPRYYDTEACAVCAAAMLMARMLGNVQAARVFIVDLLMSAQSGSVRVLPCLAAALDAWPDSLPRLGGAPRRHGDADDHVHALHSVLQQMCADAVAVGRDAGIPTDEASRGAGGEVVRLMAVRLQELGHTIWGWRQAACAGGSPSTATANETWAALQRLVDQEEAEMI